MNTSSVTIKIIPVMNAGDSHPAEPGLGPMNPYVMQLVARERERERERGEREMEKIGRRRERKEAGRRGEMKKEKMEREERKQ